MGHRWWRRVVRSRLLPDGIGQLTRHVVPDLWVFAGLGQGFAYSACLSNTIRLFPDKRGLASGLITAGMGGAAIIAAPIANRLIESQDVLAAFRILGIAYIVIVLVASLFIRKAPEDYRPTGWQPAAQGKNGPNQSELVGHAKDPNLLLDYRYVRCRGFLRFDDCF